MAALDEEDKARLWIYDTSNAFFNHMLFSPKMEGTPIMESIANHRRLVRVAQGLPEQEDDLAHPKPTEGEMLAISIQRDPYLRKLVVQSFEERRRQMLESREALANLPKSQIPPSILREMERRKLGKRPGPPAPETPPRTYSMGTRKAGD